VRGKGLFIGVELDTAKVSARVMCESMLRHGILTKDTHDNVLRFAPPLIISRAQIDEAIGRIGSALDAAFASVSNGNPPKTHQQERADSLNAGGSAFALELHELLSVLE